MGGSVVAKTPGPGDQRKRALHDAVAGAVSGCVARFVVGPLDVLKIRFQVQTEPVSRAAGKLATGGGAGPKYTGMGQALVTIVKEEGITVSGPTERGFSRERPCCHGCIPRARTGKPWPPVGPAVLGQSRTCPSRGISIHTLRQLAAGCRDYVA